MKIGKWLATQPEVIILDEPTDIDIGSKAAVHQFMSSWSARGWRYGVVRAADDGHGRRIIVMHEGLMVAEYRAGEATAKPSLAPPAASRSQEAA